MIRQGYLTTLEKDIIMIRSGYLTAGTRYDVQYDESMTQLQYDESMTQFDPL